MTQFINKCHCGPEMNLKAGLHFAWRSMLPNSFTPKWPKLAKKYTGFIKPFPDHDAVPTCSVCKFPTARHLFRIVFETSRSAVTNAI